MRRSKSPMRRQRSDDPNDPTLWRRYMNGELPEFDDSSDDEDYVPMKTRRPPRRDIPPQFR